MAFPNTVDITLNWCLNSREGKMGSSLGLTNCLIMFKCFECGAFLACPLSLCCYLLLPVFNMLSPPVTLYVHLFRPALLPSLSLIDRRDIRNICSGSPDDRKCQFWLANVDNDRNLPEGQAESWRKTI